MLISNYHHFISKHGFSFVELLVGLIISLLLISLVVTISNQTKLVTEQVLCKNHLKQIGVSSLEYNESYKILPYSSNSYDLNSWQDNSGEWYDKLDLYVKNSRNGVMHCPTTRVYGSQRWIQFGRSDLDYMCNYNISMRVTTASWNTIGPNDKFLTSRLFWYSDAAFINYKPSGWYPIISSTIVPNDPVWPPNPWTIAKNNPFHSLGHPKNTFNLVFGDAHVESLNQQDINFRCKGDQYRPPSDFCDFNGYATP